MIREIRALPDSGGAQETADGAPRASLWFLHHFGGIRRSIPDYAKHAYRQATSGYPLAFIHG